MFTRSVWLSTVGTILLALVATRSLVQRFEPVVEAVQGEILLKPPLNAGAGTGSFTNLDAAINDSEFDGAQSALSVSCIQTCLAEVEKVAVWQGFPNGAEPLRLEVSWDGSGGIPPGVQAQAYFLVEYDIGSGWQVGEEDLWVNSIPSCSPTHPAACSLHVFVEQLSADVMPGVVKVRATHRLRMTACPQSCGPASHNMLSNMQVRNIQVVAKEPTLEIDPGSPITRGDGITFWVKGAPEGTTFSNWRYEMSGQPQITRTVAINTDTWTGQLVLSGTAKVVATIPRNLLSRTLSKSATVTARNWNSEPKSPPTKVTGITPGGIPSPPEPLPRLMGSALIDADFLWHGETISDGPNKGLSYVHWVRHHDVPDARVEYEISLDVEPGKEFYDRQCGAGGFITGEVLRANGYEHESGTIRGHYQQYRDKLADPAVNFAKWAEPQFSSVSGGYEALSAVVFNGLQNRRNQINNAASVEACNQDWRYDANCTFRGNVNFPPYQPPCQ